MMEYRFAIAAWSLSILLGLPILAGAVLEGVPCEAEPTNMPISFGNLITCDITIGDIDVFRFSGTAGETVVVQVTEQLDNGSFPRVELFDPNGMLIGSDVGGSSARVDAQLDQSGMHTILVLDQNNTAVFDYLLFYGCVGNCPIPPGLECGNGICDPNENCQTCTADCNLCPDPTLDHYKCWQVKDLRNPKFQRIESIGLDDQFGNEGVAVKRPFLVCNPASKDGSEIDHPDAHQCCYKIKGPKLVFRPSVEITDQFGTLQLVVKKSRLLCQPCTKTDLP